MRSIFHVLGLHSRLLYTVEHCQKSPVDGSQRGEHQDTCPPPPVVSVKKPSTSTMACGLRAISFLEMPEICSSALHCGGNPCNPQPIETAILTRFPIVIVPKTLQSVDRSQRAPHEQSPEDQKYHLCSLQPRHSVLSGAVVANNGDLMMMTHLTTSHPAAWQCRCRTDGTSSYLYPVMQPVKYPGELGSGDILPSWPLFWGGSFSHHDSRSAGTRLLGRQATVDRYEIPAQQAVFKLSAAQSSYALYPISEL
jgi:hypothetical protein